MVEGFVGKTFKMMKMSLEGLNGDVETVEGFCYLGNANGKSEMTVAARRIGWMRFRESGEVLCGRRLLLKMKGKVFEICVRSAMLYRSETWCFRKVELLRITERAMCGRCESKNHVRNETDRSKEHRRINADV